jgi:hypothetical protein
LKALVAVWAEIRNGKAISKKERLLKELEKEKEKEKENLLKKYNSILESKNTGEWKKGYRQT